MAKPTTHDAADSSSITLEKPVPAPTKRPGTSGTENLLITNRRQASEQFQKAQKAERAYRAKKHASAARTNYTETKAHFAAAATHLRLGVKGLLGVMRALPYLAGERREEGRRKAEARKRARHLEQKKKLEEELARRSGDGDGDDDAEGGETAEGEDENEKLSEKKKGKGKGKKSAAE
ncbi:Uu.00g009950.m01.CDS01 [Anthostomella pinea]|uniref:Uu.00g009950.m01.CDS01 n=1 Tax=Anthostomella pinea TaxID=933095 RepID=A0AAI8YQ35_9PEZI|nr:Uu.00g009950.m01.CDS01 [Anthostomella pinea]